MLRPNIHGMVFGDGTFGRWSNLFKVMRVEPSDGIPGCIRRDTEDAFLFSAMWGYNKRTAVCTPTICLCFGLELLSHKNCEKWTVSLTTWSMLFYYSSQKQLGHEYRRNDGNLKTSLFCNEQLMHNNLDNLTGDVNWEKMEEHQCLETSVRTTATLGRGEQERWLGRSRGGEEASGIHITFYVLIQVLFHKFVTIMHLKKSPFCK